MNPRNLKLQCTAVSAVTGREESYYSVVHYSRQWPPEVSQCIVKFTEHSLLHVSFAVATQCHSLKSTLDVSWQNGTLPTHRGCISHGNGKSRSVYADFAPTNSLRLLSPVSERRVS